MLRKVILDCWSLAELAYVWSIHHTSGPEHIQSISLDFSFLVFHCSSQSAGLSIPPCANIHSQSFKLPIMGQCECPCWQRLCDCFFFYYFICLINWIFTLTIYFIPKRFSNKAISCDSQQGAAVPMVLVRSISVVRPGSAILSLTASLFLLLLGTEQGVHCTGFWILELDVTRGLSTPCNSPCSFL